MKQKFKNEEMRLFVELMGHLRETGKLGYAIAKNSRKMRDELPEYVDKRNELLKKHGTFVKSQNEQTEYKMDPESKAAFDEELKEYSDIDVEVDVFQVDEDTFFSGGLTNNQMEALMWMVEGEGKPADDPKKKTTAAARKNGRAAAKSVKAKVEAKIEAQE